MPFRLSLSADNSGLPLSKPTGFKSANVTSEFNLNGSF